MDARIIFLIVFIVILVIFSILHYFFSEPIDLRSWFTDELVWIWWLGIIALFSILYGFIFWSWKFMLIIIASVIFACIIIFIIYYMYVTKEDRAKKRRERHNKNYEKRVFSFLKKLIIYPTISPDFKNENDKFIENLNNIRKRLNDKFIEIKDQTNININQSTYFELNNFCQNYRDLVLSFQNSVDYRDKNNYQKIKNFYSEQYEKLNNILLSIIEEIYKAFMIKNGKISTLKTNALHLFDIIPKNLQDIARNNLQPYIDLFEFENFIRIYVNIKYFKKYGNYELTELFKNCQNAHKKAESRMQDDVKQGWKVPRGETIIFYVDFGDLSGLITNNTNFQLFKDDFKNLDFIKIRLDELYQIRINVAHNVGIGQNEINNLASWTNQIYSQLAKYKEEIKNWKI